MSAAQMFRSCTASLSSKTLARDALSSRQLGTRRLAVSLPSRRHYSDGKEKTEGAEKTETEKSSSGEEKKSEVASDPTADKLKAKEAEVVDLTGRLRYLQADFLNLQRNAAREKEQQRDFAITRFAGDLLETVDVLSLALKSVPKSVLESSSDETTSDSSSTPPPPPTSQDAPPVKSAEAYLKELYTGVEMTHRLLQQTLFKYHVKPFDPTGDKFDPNRHEALYQAPVPGAEPGTVIDCQKIGFTIKDRILRAAQVGVAQETS
ncbi:hypothetical protein PLICRDRAFT_110246 [Plicaturopsis crispa FD-325 SS-3]|nr:hypothetical protein PLICRDRAFT_110246 [Plicaturopsis crispa FD-325 SS-3]